MTEMIRHNLMAWALALITLALAASVGWVFKISTSMVELRVEMLIASKEVDRNRSVVDGLRSDIAGLVNSLSILMQQDNALSEFLDRIEDRQSMHSERISAHEALGWHNQAGLLINGIQIKLENLINIVVNMKKEIDKGERYTLEMATENNNKIYSAIGNTENSMQSSINELIELQRMMIKQGLAGP